MGSMEVVMSMGGEVEEGRVERGHRGSDEWKSRGVEEEVG